MTREKDRPPLRLGSITEAGIPRIVIDVPGGLYRLSEVASRLAFGTDSMELWKVEAGLEYSLGVPEFWDFLDRAAEYLTGNQDIDPLTGDYEFLPPIARPGKVIGVGANYQDHLEEMGAQGRPPRPYLFFKPSDTTQIGHLHSISAPTDAKWFDWEAELAVVIGLPARNVTADAALSFVAGYTVANDLSIRDAVAEATPPLGIDWLRAKGGDGFTPIGPWLTPARYVPDPQALDIASWVNGIPKQVSNTSRMVFSVAEIIAYASSLLTLRPGDVILTGTPAGVGIARKPPETLVAGDTVTIAVATLGEIETQIV